MRDNIEQVRQQRHRECQNSRTLQGERVGWRSSVRYQNSPPEQILGRAQNSASSAPIVLVETYIRRRFVKLAFHDFDGCHPRRGAGRLCQQSGTGHDDDESGQPCENFHCDPPVPAVGIERLSHGPRSLYEAFHTPSAGKGRCSPLRPSYWLRPRSSRRPRCLRCGAIPNNRHAGSSVQSWSDGRGAVEWATGGYSTGALCDRAVTAGGSWRAALPGQKLRRWP